MRLAPTPLRSRTGSSPSELRSEPGPTPERSQGAITAPRRVGRKKPSSGFAGSSLRIWVAAAGAWETAETDGACEQIYKSLADKGVEPLYHDLDERPGAKFATADLVGIPWQILVGPRSLAEGKVEVKRRADGSKELMSVDAAVDRVSA